MVISVFTTSFKRHKKTHREVKLLHNFLSQVVPFLVSYSSHHHQFDSNQCRVIIFAISQSVSCESGREGWKDGRIYGITSEHQWNRMKINKTASMVGCLKVKIESLKSSWNSLVFGNGTGRIHGLNFKVPVFSQYHHLYVGNTSMYSKHRIEWNLIKLKLKLNPN